MKLLTAEEIKETICKKIIQLPLEMDDDFPLRRNNFLNVSHSDGSEVKLIIKNVVDGDTDKLSIFVKKYKEIVNKIVNPYSNKPVFINEFIMVPNFFHYIMNFYRTETDIKKIETMDDLLEKWYRCFLASDISIPNSKVNNLPATFNLIEFLLYTIIPIEKLNNINERGFWFIHNEIKESYIKIESLPSSLKKKYFPMLVSKFETIEDVIDFEKNIVNKYSYNTSIQFYIWKEALKKIVPIHTLDNPSTILTHISFDNRIHILMECIEVLEYYKFELIKESLIRFVEKCPNTKVVQAAKKILDNNNYTKIQTLELKEKDEIVYIKEIDFNFSYFKDKINDPALSITLVEIIMRYLREENMTINYSLKDNEMKVIMKGNNVEEINILKDVFLKCCDFSFNVFVSNIQCWASTSDFGKRVQHENISKTIQEFKYGFKKYMFACELNNTLPEGKAKVSNKKI